MMNSCAWVEISGLDLACTPNVYLLDIILGGWFNNLDGRCVMFQNPISIISSRRLQGFKLYTDMFPFVHAWINLKKHIWKAPCNLHVYCVLLRRPHPKNIKHFCTKGNLPNKHRIQPKNCTSMWHIVIHGKFTYIKFIFWRFSKT